MRPVVVSGKGGFVVEFHKRAPGAAVSVGAPTGEFPRALLQHDACAVVGALSVYERLAVIVHGIDEVEHIALIFDLVE